MNIYEKIAAARVKLADGGLKKGGTNEHTRRAYFELADFLPTLTRLGMELGFACIPSFGVDLATLTIVDTAEPSSTIVITTPMSTAELKGVHAVQNLGAVQTYLRRYLYMAAFEIVETDALDSAEPTKPTAPKATKPAAEKPDWVNRAEAAGLRTGADDVITPAQRSALTGMCGTNTAVLTEIRKNMGYEKTSQIRQSDYAEVERRLKVALGGQA